MMVIVTLLGLVGLRDLLVGQGRAAQMGRIWAGFRPGFKTSILGGIFSCFVSF